MQARTEIKRNNLDEQNNLPAVRHVLVCSRECPSRVGDASRAKSKPISSKTLTPQPNDGGFKRFKPVLSIQHCYMTRTAKNNTQRKELIRNNLKIGKKWEINRIKNKARIKYYK